MYQAKIQSNSDAAHPAESVVAFDFRSALHLLPQMVWIHGPDEGDEFYNRHWVEFTGVDLKKANAVRRSDLVHEEDRERADRAWNHSLRTGAPYECEYRLRHRSQGFRWVLSRASTEDGRIWFGICTDIHDRVTAQSIVERNQDRFRRILDSMPQMVWSMPEGKDRPDYYSQRWYEFTGLPEGSTFGDAWEGFIHPEDVPGALAAWRACRRRGDGYEGEYRLRNASGAYRWVISRGRLEDDPSGGRRWYGTCTDVHERRLANEALNESQRRIHTTLNSIPQVIWTAGADGKLDFISEQWNDLFEPVDRPALEDHWLLSIHEDDQDGAWRAWSKAIATGEPYETEFRIVEPSGAARWVLVRARPERGEDGQVSRWYGTCTDIHTRVLAEQSAAESNRLSRGIIDASPDCMSLIGLDGKVVFANRATAAAYSVDAGAELIGRHWEEAFPKPLRPKAAGVMRKALQGRIGRVLLQFGRRDPRWWDIVMAPILAADGSVHRVMIVSRDVTDQKAAEERAQWAANHDSLTELPNRFLLQKQLRSVAARAEAGAKGYALLLLDLDHFKRINDTVGHDAGDAFLVTFANRLKEVVRPGNLVARLGGDEFAILLSNISERNDLSRVIGEISDALHEPCVYSGHILELSVSIGAALLPQSGPEDPLKQADIALYAAKSAGRGCWKLFEPSMLNEVRNRSSMLNLARSAIDGQWIQPHYQPKVDLQTGSIVGFEALLRWQRPGEDAQPPASLAAAFDDPKLACEISASMLAQVMTHVRQWEQEGVPFGHIAVNAAAAEFRHGDFAERLLEKIANCGISTGSIQVEVTETVFLGRGACLVDAALRLLHANSITVALDDFGTGYASLSHLKQFPVDLIKIDRSFVRGLEESAGDTAIVEAVIGLGGSLGIDVVAEGIETPSQHHILRKMGCRYGQGFFYGRAAPGDLVPSLCRASYGPELQS